MLQQSSKKKAIQSLGSEASSADVLICINGTASIVILKSYSTSKGVFETDQLIVEVNPLNTD